MKYFLLSFLVQDPGLDEVLRRLGSDRIEERDEAARLLEEKAPERELRAAAAGADAETAARAREILEKLEPRRKRALQEVSHLLEHAAVELKAGRADSCLRLCDAILAVSPDYGLVRRLKAKSAEAARELLCWYDVEPWTRVELPEAPELPLRARADLPKDALRGIEHYSPEEPASCILRPEHRLKTARITVDLQNVPLADALETLSDLSGLRIVFDAAAAEHVDPAQQVSFKVSDIVADGALRLLIQPRGLRYRVTEERIVLVTVLPRAE